METNDRQFQWVEKYRPARIADCILPVGLKKQFQAIATSGVIPNMILAGRPGIGKTTVAKALCEEMDRNMLFVSASEQGQIDNLRNNIRQFASGLAFNGNPKVVVFDEGDGLSRATQDALKSFIEEFSHNCSFIFTVNNKGRLLEAIRDSRMATIDFNVPKEEKGTLAKAFKERCEQILKLENIAYEPQDVTQVILHFFPDFRRVLVELQNKSMSGSLDIGEVGISDASLLEVIAKMAEKDMTFVRKWAATNCDSDPQRIFRRIYDILYTKLEPASIADGIVIVAKYQHWAVTAANHEINLMACLVEIAYQCQFKK